jgi:hypothetical protein
MNLHDLETLIKKILVGIAITAIPAGILLGGLWVTQHALERGPFLWPERNRKEDPDLCKWNRTSKREWSATPH